MKIGIPNGLKYYDVLIPGEKKSTTLLQEKQQKVHKCLLQGFEKIERDCQRNSGKIVDGGQSLKT